MQLARSNKIDTVNQALVMIGAHGLSRWLNILLFAGAGEDGVLSPLFKLASSRGKLMELLQFEIIGPEPDSDAKEIAERAFLIGMLSLVHVVLGMSEQKTIEELNLSKEIRVAPENHEGQCGSLLHLCNSIEDSDIEMSEEILSAVGLSREQLQNAQVASFAWGNGL